MISLVYRPVQPVARAQRSRPNRPGPGLGQRHRAQLGGRLGSYHQYSTVTFGLGFRVGSSSRYHRGPGRCGGSRTWAWAQVSASLRPCAASE